MKLRTSSQVGTAFRHLKNLVSQIDEMKIIGFDTVTLESAAKESLEILIHQLEGMVIAQNYSVKHKFNMVLESGCWFPVDTLELNTQGGAIWSIKGGNSITAEHGTSRFGQFSDIGTDNLPYIHMTLDDIRKQTLNFI
jgi:hypothetical protein